VSRAHPRTAVTRDPIASRRAARGRIRLAGAFQVKGRAGPNIGPVSSPDHGQGMHLERFARRRQSCSETAARDYSSETGPRSSTPARTFGPTDRKNFPAKKNFSEKFFGRNFFLGIFFGGFHLDNQNLDNQNLDNQNLDNQLFPPT